MHTFRVWAPLPKKVEIHLGNEVIPMIPNSGGWWSVETSKFDAAQDYGFVLDGRGPFPDPRSEFQPHGVTGLSRVVNHSGFAWGDSGWQAPPLSSAIIYELHVGTFSTPGTFEGVISRLDHLVDLGVTHIELMPVNEFPGTRGWGYDGVDLFAPHHGYGGPDELKRLVEACHLRGLAVILDVVYNHLGPSGNYLDKFGPYFTSVYSTPWGKALNFDDHDSDEVRRFFCDNALMWLRDYHIDGLRLDAVHGIRDSSAVHFLEQLVTEVKRLEAQLGRHLVLIPESDLNDPRLLWSREHGGMGLHAQWCDDFHHALHTVLTGEKSGYYADFGTLADLGKALTQGFVYDGRYSAYRRRRHGRSSAGLTGHRFVTYLQNHDQVGNRAKGDRIGAALKPGRLKIGAALTLLSPFLPMLFQGEEWNASTPFQYFTDHESPDLGKAVTEGRRNEFCAFGWDASEIPDPQSPATFSNSKLNWPEIGQPAHAEILEWYKALIRLRRSESVLMDGRLEKVRTRFDENARWFVMKRGAFGVACNPGTEACGIRFDACCVEILLASQAGIRAEGETVMLPPDSVAVIKTQSVRNESQERVADAAQQKI